MLDLHTGPIATEYLYSASRQINEINDFKIKNVIEIPNEFSGAMDEAFFISWHHLDALLNKNGKQPLNYGRSFTVELESEEDVTTNKTKYFKEIILNYLASKNCIEKLDKTQIEQTIRPLKNFKTYFFSQGGMYEYSKPPGSVIKKNEILAKYINQTSGQWKTVEAIEDCIIINHCPSSQVYEGMELIQVLEI